ncbi:hypothetical protein SERLA73DRAFT_74862 [Serpula lacrymans var. lacrymans S7.3]|uniref:Uncharacterized protein n=2 Tax=Serpula lacrymans var. lacrymans TaxID=341189 RepID=F8Q1U8_SERL3|nr:hypothetical protein SERLA73DRAFT_74862 [Serpula lacrymans var. lacrymans S7.3]
MTSTILEPVTSLTQVVSKTVVHSTIFPFTLAPTLHAARISIAFQAQVRASGNKPNLTWAMYLAGFLIMSWGGSIWTHMLLSLPPPPLYSFSLWINYLSVHLCLTAFFHIFPTALVPRFFDTTLIPIDAILRLGSITSSLSLVHSYPDPRLSQSIFFRLIIGAIASAGGGVTAATFGVWTSEWRLSTPIFLKGSILSTADIWGGSIAAFVYDYLTVSRPTYPTFLLPWLPVSPTEPFLTHDSARSAATIVLASIFAWRVTKIHWATKKPKLAEKTE